MTRRLPGLVILAGAALVSLALGAEYFLHPDTISLPPRLGEFYLHHRLEGPAATEAFTTLHGHWLPLSAAAVGYYGDEGEATLWIARAPFSWLTAWMFDRMHARIAACESTFHPAGEQPHRGHRVYEATGESRSHFYFMTGHQIVWLDVDPDQAEAELERVLSFFP